MKKILLSLLLTSSIGFTQTEKQVVDFTKVTAFDQIDVTLIPSTENKVVLKGGNADEVELVNKNGELKIRMPLTKLLSGDDVSATIYYKKITALEANEGSTISSNDTLQTTNLELITKEGATINLQHIDAQNLNLRCGSGSIITLKGIVQYQDVLVNSGARYDGLDCYSKITNVTVNAGGIADIYASEKVSAKTRAGGTISVYGNPKNIDEKTVIGGTIRIVK